MNKEMCEKRAFSFNHEISILNYFFQFFYFIQVSDFFLSFIKSERVLEIWLELGAHLEYNEV